MSHGEYVTLHGAHGTAYSLKPTSIGVLRSHFATVISLRAASLALCTVAHHVSATARITDSRAEVRRAFLLCMRALLVSTRAVGSDASRVEAVFLFLSAAWSVGDF